MADAHLPDVQSLIHRHNDGDAAATNQLLELCYDYLCRIARGMLYGDFGRLRGRHDTQSVVHEGLIDLLPKLREIKVLELQHFYRLAASYMRYALLNMCRDYRRRPALGLSDCVNSDASIPNDTYNPEMLACWASFHEAVERLPIPERDVVDLLWYHDFTQDEAARILGMTQKQVSRVWIRARRALVPFLPVSMASAVK